MDQIVLAAKDRGSATKGILRTKRLEGIIPGIVYGAKEKSVSVWIVRKALEREMTKARSVNVLFSLEIADEAGQKSKAKAETVLLKSLQRDPAKSIPVHVDFFRVDVHKKVEVPVPLRVSGEAKGVKNQGGILEHLLREIRVRCLPTDIPEAITVDVTDLEIGHGILVRNLKLPSGVEMLTEENHVVLNVIAPHVVEEAPAAEAAAAPEVIAKGKKEAEEGVVPAAGAKTAAAPGGKAPAAAGKAEQAPAKK